MMNQLKFFKIALVILVIINIGVVSSIFLNRKKGPPHHHRDGRFSIEKTTEQLNLSENQAERFEQEVEKHKLQMEGLNESRQVLLQQYFQSILDEEMKKEASQILLKLTEGENQKIQITYQHFEEVKSILNEDQIDDFEVFMDNAIGMILQNNNVRKHGKNKPPH